MKGKGILVLTGVLAVVVALMFTNVIPVPQNFALADPGNGNAKGVGNNNGNSNEGNGNGSTHQHNQTHHNNFNNHHNTVILCPGNGDDGDGVGQNQQQEQTVDIENVVIIEGSSDPPSTPKPPINGNGCKDYPSAMPWYLTEFSGNIPVIAILDTGIDKWHEDLRGLVVAERSFIDEDPWDYHGHGTHVAGIIVAKDNDIGITGVAAGYPLINAKVADGIGRCNPLDMAKAVHWAVEEGATVINISCAINETNLDLENAVANAIKKGIIVVAAAGNNGENASVYPACLPGVIAVGSVDENGELAALSNRGPWVDMYALGVNVYSCLPDDDYGEKSGTSFAAAYITGLMALAQN